MEHISKAISAVMSRMPAPTTKEPGHNTKPSSSDVPPPEPKLRPEFQTLGDPALEAMVDRVAAFQNEMVSGGKPRWLSLVGGSGNGKTMLARKVFRWQSEYLRVGEWRQSALGVFTRSQDGLFCFWPKYAEGLSFNNQENRRELEQVWFLVVDEIGRSNLGPVARDNLFMLLNSRLGKWTFITSNKNLSWIADNLDGAIASRMVRDGNEVFECTAPDWAMRHG